MEMAQREMRANLVGNEDLGDAIASVQVWASFHADSWATTWDTIENFAVQASPILDLILEVYKDLQFSGLSSNQGT